MTELITHIGQLKPDSKNARRHTPRNVGSIVSALHEVGAARSIVIDEDNVILAGNATIDAAAQAGIERVRVVEADGNEIIAVRRSGLTGKQKTRLALYDNRAAELAEWDTDVLADLQSGGDVLEGLFTTDELDTLLADLNKPDGAGGDDFDTTPQDGPTRVQRGEVWRVGVHRVMCGDGTDAGDVARLMQGQRADMVLTDPPYGMCLDADYSKMSGNGRKGRKWDDVTGDDKDFDPSFLMIEFAYCAEQFWWGADYYVERIPNKNDGSWLVWDKTLESNGDAGYNSEFELCWMKQPHKREIIRFNWFRFFGLSKQDVKTRQHPTQKPIQVIEPLVARHSKKGELIVDPFLGSGTTLIAAHRTGRVCYGMEIEPRYADVILRRAEAEGIGPVERIL